MLMKREVHARNIPPLLRAYEFKTNYDFLIKVYPANQKGEGLAS